MKPITVITGPLAPLPRANVDTDQIMPKQFLKRVERTGYGEFLFHEWSRADPSFVLNRPEYRGARTLVAGPNFGCGSSREHAPWGLQDWGFEAIVSPSFADIFRNNCTKIGLLPVELSEKEVAWLMELAEADPTAEVTIDLAAQTVTAAGFEARFEIDPYTKWRLANGLDDIGLTLQQVDAIDAFERSRPDYRPAVTASDGS
jgi:3-isopropylmalate/(R)-2-methylmalate dehydratase small subunit